MGLDSETIEACFRSHPETEEETVQSGLTKWCGGQGNKLPTWGVLFAAMEYAQIAEQHVHKLKKETGLFGKQCVTDGVRVCECVCVHADSTCTQYKCPHHVHMCSRSASVCSVMQWTLLATS